MADLYADLPYVEPGTVMAKLNFLAGVNEMEAIQTLTRSIKEVRLHGRETLHAQDAPVSHVWVVLEGEIAQQRRELDGQGRPRQRLERACGPGALIGVYDYLFDTGTYRTRARATQPCRLLAIEVAGLSRLIFRFPSVRTKLAPLKVIQRLCTLPLIGSIEPVGLGFLADALKPVAYKADEVVYQAGASEEQVFLLSQGQVVLEWRDGHTNWIGNGAIFGLVKGGNTEGPIGARTMAHSAKVTVPADVFVLLHTAFFAITGYTPDPVGLAAMAERERIIGGLPIFSQFSERQRRQTTGYCGHNYYPTNHLLIQQDEQADSLWVLMPGSNAMVRALDNAGQPMLGAAAAGATFFGETALLGEIAQDSTVEADPGSEWLRLHWRDFEQFDNIDPDDLRAMLQIQTAKQPKLVGKSARKKYPWLQPGESVIYFSRRHWVAFFRKNAATILFFLIFVALTVIGVLMPGIDNMIRFMLGLLALLIFVALMWGIVDYMNDWLVVTNRRVVYQEKLLFVHVWRKEAPLENIQNVDFRTTFIGRWFGFGTLIVQTAGTTGTIAFDYTTHFDVLKQVIKTQQEQRKRHAAAQSKTQIHRQLERRLGLQLAPPSGIYAQTVLRDASAVRKKGTSVVWRKHWMALLPQIGWAWIIPVFFVLILLVMWAASNDQIPDEWLTATFGFEFVVSLMILIFMARLAWVIVDWRNDTYEVSESDIVNVHKLPFGIREDRRAAGLGRVQNVEMRIPSPIHWLFDYGNVTIQTAAEFGAMEFYAVPNPRAVADEILARMDRFQKRQAEDDARRRSQDLPDWFEMYNRLEPGTAILDVFNTPNGPQEGL